MNILVIICKKLSKYIELDFLLLSKPIMNRKCIIIFIILKKESSTEFVNLSSVTAFANFCRGRCLPSHSLKDYVGPLEVPHAYTAMGIP